MAVRYIIQKREVKERHGRKPQLMGPYRTCYSDIKPPFDLSDKGKIEAHLLRRYGEGRYQVKMVGREEGEEKSTIKMLFSGDIERYKSRAKRWTKEERVEFIRERYRTQKEKTFAMAGFLLIFIVLSSLFFFTLAPVLDPSVNVLIIIALIVVFMLSAFFIDNLTFETE